jgi:protein-disulfide isomerase
MNHTHIALAIAIGSVLVSTSIMLLGLQTTETRSVSAGSGDSGQVLSLPERSVPAYSYGNTNAEITVVEFSDLECPFCARLHPTLKELVDTSAGSIRWEYRHLPLSSHLGAFPAAVASECVGRQLGSEGFFSFLDAVFTRLGNYEPAKFRAEAIALGVHGETFDTCLVDTVISDLVTEDAAAASQVGARGTPFSVIVDSSGVTQSLSGALPLAQWQSVISLIRTQ